MPIGRRIGHHALVVEDTDVTICYRLSPHVDDADLNDLHARAFGHEANRRQWSRQLAEHSLGWVCAYHGDTMVGFVNVAWDGGAHAFILDICVEPSMQHHSIGRSLVDHAAALAVTGGCEWLHVDFASELAAFYITGCGFRPTAAGLIRLLATD
jgi:ribosomal protein S18 acetylase RimI-like enzyme